MGFFVIVFCLFGFCLFCDVQRVGFFPIFFSSAFFLFFFLFFPPDSVWVECCTGRGKARLEVIDKKTFCLWFL